MRECVLATEGALMSRTTAFDRIVQLCGGLLTNPRAETGWPGFADLDLGSGHAMLAIHAGPVGLSHRGRDSVERRFQNPGKERPVIAPAGTVPLLLGVWEEGAHPVLVGMDPTHRLDHMTRFSLFVPLWLLQQVAERGWGEHYSASNERIIAFHPALLPAYVQLRLSGADVSASEVLRTIAAAGFGEEEGVGWAERARRATTQLVRDRDFGQHVVQAYGGLCAICRLDFQLAQGAHIYPASAPQSPDEIWNGLALCPTHHVAFDKHLLWADPVSRSIRLHPDVVAGASANDACRRFVDSTAGWLAEPSDPECRPKAEMFERRYEFYAERYGWVA